jgi:N-acetylmuramic acid 6-phosphate etherase
MVIDLERLTTETKNIKSQNIDKVSTLEMLKIINDEDKKVAYAVEKELPKIAKAVDMIAECMLSGGRLIYCGAGTSGRLGILDAAECPPTFGVDSELVKGLIAGGAGAIFKAIEGAEDSKELGAADLKAISFSSKDILVGIAASGRTPYVIGALEYARNLGSKTISINCNHNSELERYADISITPIVGPEVITGSTRMKAGTSQKMVLNMLSTGTMIKLGKVYGNLMVDVKPTNQKLVERAKKIVCDATGKTYIEAERLLEQTNYNVKLAIFIAEAGLPIERSIEILNSCHGHINDALLMVQNSEQQC